MRDGKISIAFSVNNEYTLFGYIAIYSLIKHANRNSEYYIYVLVTNLDDNNRVLLESLTAENVFVKCIDISEIISRVHLEASLHLSVETYYRLFIPLILPQHERILYLDSDLVVLGDVADIFSLDLNGKAVGAARDVLCNNLKIHSEEIGGLDYKKSFNAGVLLMDTRRFEEENVREKCLKLLEEDYKRADRRLIFADQDALNIVLYDNVTILDSKWNCQYQYAWRIEEVDQDYKEQYLTDLDHALIMHYAGTNKPWAFPLLPKAELFWNIAKETPVFLRLLEKTISAGRDAKKSNQTKRYLFPYDMVPSKSKIALYGAGRIGKEFYDQIRSSGYADIVIWVDQKADEITGGYDIRSVDDIFDVDFDFVVISIKNKEVSEEVCRKLMNRGIAQDRIIWRPY